MENEAKRVVNEFLAAVQQGDNAKLAELLSPEIKWSQPGDNAVSGIKHSNMEVFQMVGKMFEISGNTLRLTEIRLISVNSNKVACVLRWNANKATGEILEIDNIDVYTVENGQIIRAEIYSADLEKENTFWN
jgi:ketosteroid isomerase-like protein